MGVRADSTPCPDPSCPGRAEPEQGGDFTFMECTECGYAFGFTRKWAAVVQPGEPGDVGVPEDTRRSTSSR